MSSEEPSHSMEKPWHGEGVYNYDRVRYRGETYLATCIRIVYVTRWWGPLQDWLLISRSGSPEVRRHLKAGHYVSLAEEIEDIWIAFKTEPGRHWKEIVAKHSEEPWESLCLVLVPEVEEASPLYKLLFPEYLFERSSQEITEEIGSNCMQEYYYELANEINRDLDNRTITISTFRSLFRRLCIIVKPLGGSGATGEPFSIKVVNQLSESLTTGPDVLLDFLRSVFNSAVKALEQKHIISQCKLCRDYFRYIRGKKRCSIKSERKDCAGKAADQRYYAKHGEKIREKSRKRMKEIRAR